MVSAQNDIILSCGIYHICTFCHLAADHFLKSLKGLFSACGNVSENLMINIDLD